MSQARARTFGMAAQAAGIGMLAAAGLGIAFADSLYVLGLVLPLGVLGLALVVASAMVRRRS